MARIFDAPDPDYQGPVGEVRRDSRLGSQDLTTWHTKLGELLVTVVQWVSRRLGPNPALVLTLVIGGILAVVLSFVAGQVYDSVLDKDGVAGFDRPLLDFALTLRSPGLDSALTAYTDIGGVIGMPILAVVIMTVLAIKRRSWTPVILITAAGVGSLLMTVAGKQIIGRVRPPLIDAVPPYEYSPSFPSGHTLNAIVIAGVVAYLLVLRRQSVHGRVLTIVVATVFAVSIGLSRVYLGHHWFTDVLAAWALGLAWLALVITAHRLYLTTRKRHHEAATASS